MSYRTRQKDITTPVAQLVALAVVLVVLALAFSPELRLAAGVCVVLAIGSMLGWLLYRLTTRTRKSGSAKETRPDNVVSLRETSKAVSSPEVLAPLKDNRKLCPKCESEVVLRTAEKRRNPGSKF